LYSGEAHQSHLLKTPLKRIRKGASDCVIGLIGLLIVGILDHRSRKAMKDAEIIVCHGNAKPNDLQLMSRVVAADEEIIA